MANIIAGSVPIGLQGGSGEDPALVLRLIRSRRVGPATFHRLIAENGSVEGALRALPDIARQAGIADYEPCPLGVVRAEMASGRRAGARLLTWFDDAYPAELREISDAPAVLWMRGNLRVLDSDKIAVIGARNASSLGLRMARSLAAGLGAAGITTVAGLARGIDSAAHEATLATGTIAVMASGIDIIYPQENSRLADAIYENGAVLTEQPPGMSPIARHFPARNRIVSALSRAVVVVEAAERSGTLLTAKNALDQGREVMAVPGHPFDGRASGCNNLIRDGATLVRTVADVLTALNAAPVIEAASEAPEVIAVPDDSEQRRADQIRQRILEKLNVAPTEENSLIRELGLPPAAIAPSILSLELSGEIQRMPGGYLARH